MIFQISPQKKKKKKRFNTFERVMKKIIHKRKDNIEKNVLHTFF